MSADLSIYDDCLPIYIIYFPGDVSTIQCDADGTWSLLNALCQIHCKAPSTTLSSRLMTKNCKRGYHPLGKICKFKCEKEFKVQGKSRIR
jgi:pappalysin-1